MEASRLYIVDLASSLAEACGGRGCSRECLREFIHWNYRYLRPYVEEHLDGRIDVLVDLLDEMFSLHPRLCKSKIELKGYPVAGMEEVLSNLSLLLQWPINAVLILFYTGFDLALSAYGEYTYVGLEWFADPSLVGELRDPGLREVVGYLHRRGWGFIAANLAHELAHIHTPTIKGDPLLARLLEEGRACLVSWLVNPHAGIEGILPLVGRSLSEYEGCHGELLQLLARYMRGEAVVSERELFSPTFHDPVCGLPMTGYYLDFLAVHKLLLGRGVNYVLSMDDTRGVLGDLLEAIA